MPYAEEESKHDPARLPRLVIRIESGVRDWARRPPRQNWSSRQVAKAHLPEGRSDTAPASNQGLPVVSGRVSFCARLPACPTPRRRRQIGPFSATILCVPRDALSFRRNPFSHAECFRLGGSRAKPQAPPTTASSWKSGEKNAHRETYLLISGGSLLLSTAARHREGGRQHGGPT